MPRRLLALFLISILGALAAPASPGMAAVSPPVDPAILAPIDSLVSAANAGSAAGARTAYVTSPAIVDDFPPFRWAGTGAVTQWTTDLAGVLKQYGITDGRFARHTPTYAHIAGSRAWVVIPSDYTFTLKGKAGPQKVASVWTFVLTKARGGWRIESSTWATLSSTLE